MSNELIAVSFRWWIYGNLLDNKRRGFPSLTEKSLGKVQKDKIWDQSTVKSESTNQRHSFAKLNNWNTLHWNLTRQMEKTSDSGENLESYLYLSSCRKLYQGEKSRFWSKKSLSVTGNVNRNVSVFLEKLNNLESYTVYAHFYK